MATATPNSHLREAIEELKKEFLDSIPMPPRPMAPFNETLYLNFPPPNGDGATLF
jgi:hypothetical protein